VCVSCFTTVITNISLAARTWALGGVVGELVGDAHFDAAGLRGRRLTEQWCRIESMPGAGR
jgi:hypothetical protein